MNLVKIVMEVAKKLKGLEDDLLVAELLDVQLVEVVHSEVEQALVIRQLETSLKTRRCWLRMRKKNRIWTIGCEHGEWGGGRTRPVVRIVF